jgi:hypothetical protein
MDMRRLLGTVLPTVFLVMALGAGLAACGDDEGDPVADDTAPTASATETSSGTPTDSPTKGGDDDAVDFELVDTITETAAGGATSETAVPLPDDEAVQEFNSQFETDAMKAKVQDAVRSTDVPDGMLLYGAVVAVGCDAPTEVSVTTDDSGVVIMAQKVPSPMQECFAPMTTVALVLVPTSAVS